MTEIWYTFIDMHKEQPIVLHLITQAEFGGAQKYVYEIATGLTSEFRFVVGAGELTKSHELLVRLQHAGIYTLQLSKLTRSIHPVFDLIALYQVTRIILKIKPDIIHLHTSKISIIGSLGAWLAKLLTRFSRTPYKPTVIYTSHGWVFSEKIPPLQKLFYRWAEKMTARFKDVIIVLSQVDRDLARQYHLGDNKTYHIVPNGIHLETSAMLSKSDARAALQSTFRSHYPHHPFDTKPHETWIGVVANLYENKGIDVLIRAIAQLKTSIEALGADSPVRVMILGEGAMESKLRAQIATENLDQTIFLVGRVKDAWKYLHAFDIFTLPSYKEGFPYAVLEAMDAGLPVVATRVGALPECITSHENGILVEPGDDTALASALLELIHHKDKRTLLAKAGQTTVRTSFTTEIFLDRIREIYRRQ